MKRLLIAATLALGVLAGVQTQANADCGIGIGIGLNLNFSTWGSKKCCNSGGQGQGGYGYPGCNPCYAMGGMPGAMSCGNPYMPYGGMGMNPMAMAGYGGYPMLGMPPAFGGGFNPAMAMMGMPGMGMPMGGMAYMGMPGMGMPGMGMPGMGMDPTMLAMSGFGGFPPFGGMNGFAMPGGPAGFNGMAGMSPFGNGLAYGQPVLISVDYGDNQSAPAAKTATVAAETPATPGVVAAAQ